ncbi:uncharacterized protein Z520_08319 [Fonsecaea multimorphosa CBS 102226]|uniref:Uncharacterized protein n=1 Tax=Fonsecaea multimorphosa CBS 102226 TaxID=1442371 RepID=A0A0D2JZN0_9EURO|nr:uncharacterized protein Z520_08319 [Fonsecaea multimorphosa CBS 102226]KIX96064.1 hypothetical protein Z520_08319 [Fonsecaea multimorphosa CBS 102226]OAL21830.1 hypothetical protein AYO22_07772 [Fonsecaea multimorphosa]
MDKNHFPFSSRNQSLFPLSAKPFTHAKTEAFVKANTMASYNGKTLPQSFTPSIDMSGVKFFGPLDEVDNKNHPGAPSAVDKSRRATKERIEEARQKTALRKAREDRFAQVEAENKEFFACKKQEEDDRQARLQALKAARKALGRAALPAIRAPRKRKRNASDDDSVAAAGRRLSSSGSSNASSTLVNNDNNGNGMFVDVDATGGTRIFHGKARYHPMVIDSDDEEALLRSSKRRRSSNDSSSEEPLGEKAIEGYKSNSTVSRNDSQRAKRKLDDRDDNDADPPNDEQLIQKRRKYQHVRRESDKENMPTKRTS